MTVAELMEKLQWMPQDAVVFVGSGTEFNYTSNPAVVVDLEWSGYDHEVLIKD